jgi:hypothetical protein
MDHYFVARSQETGFIAQLSVEEISRQFRTGELLGSYVATKVVAPSSSYLQVMKSGTAVWVTVADLVAHMPAQNVETSPNLSGNTGLPSSAMPLDKNRIATWVGCAGGGVFFILHKMTEGQAAGGVKAGVIGFTLGYALAWLVLAFIPANKGTEDSKVAPPE